MKLTVNGFEIEIQEDGDGFTFRVKKEGGVSISAAAALEEDYSTNNFYRKQSTSTKTLSDDLKAIIEIVEISPMTMVMISNKVLGVPTSGDDLPKQFPDITKSAVKYLKRSIKEDIWALLLAPIKIPAVGEVTAAVGINGENQLTILGYAETASELYSDIIDRGLSPKKVKIGVLKADIDKKTFSKAFPQAEIGNDWHEFRDSLAETVNKDLVSDAMKATKKTEAQKILKKLNPPNELFSHFDFDSKLWRALKSTSPVLRVEIDVRQRVKLNVLEKSQIDMAVAWALVRLQYQWLRVPVDSAQLQNLKYT